MLKKFSFQHSLHFFTSLTLLSTMTILEGAPAIEQPLLASRKIVNICEGPQGPVGPQGPPGLIGPRGNQGQQGAQGDFGPQGPAGPIGPTGPTGPQGRPGDNGDVGPEGQEGPEGPRGPTGLTGPQGCPGFKGSFGPTGPTGVFGPTGASGLLGSSGTVAGFAVARSETSIFTEQNPIGPGENIPLEEIAISSPGFQISVLFPGTITVPVTGTYLLYYQVQANAPCSIAITVNGTIVASSIYSTNLPNQLVAGSVIVALTAGSNVGLVNNNQTDSINTTSSPPAQNSSAPAPVEMVFIILTSP